MKVSERRMAENEVVFRKANEKVTDDLDQLKKLAAETKQESLVIDDINLEFYCECSDENCRMRVKLSTNDYSEIHKNRARFVIVPEHEVLSIENVISRGHGFWVVEKHEVPSKDATVLKETDVSNV
jgi:hypothetical protein